MKRLRFLSLFAVILIVTFAFCGCEKEEDSAFVGDSADKKSLYSHGYDVVRLIHEKTSDDYYVSSVLEIPEALKAPTEIIAKGKNKELSAVFTVAFDSVGYKRELEELSDELSEDIEKQLGNTMLTSCLNRYGEVSIAVSASFASEKTFVNKSLKDSIIYLYCFEDSYPIAVTFIPGDDNSVSAKGRVLSAEDLIGADSRADFKEFFGDVKYEMRKVDTRDK